MDNLNADELALLEQIKEHEWLRREYFKKANNLKWFERLKSDGYFDPENNPAPVSTDEERYYSVPFWFATEYLVKSSRDINNQGNHDIAQHFLDIIREATKYAMKAEFSNYRTWYQFSKIIQNIPVELITQDDIDNIDFWLDDKFDRNLVARELGEVWLPTLLNQSDNESKRVASDLLELLYKTEPTNYPANPYSKNKLRLRIDNYWAEEIIKKTAEKCGKVLGEDAVRIFRDRLKAILDLEKTDRYSNFWCPAIEDHDQNSTYKEPSRILVSAVKKSLEGYIHHVGSEAVAIVSDLLDDDFRTVKRIALHAITENFQLLKKLAKMLISEQYFDTDIHHEMWNFLHKCYPFLHHSDKNQIDNLIEQLDVVDENGKPTINATAYRKATWLSAIKDYNEDAERRYKEYRDQAGREIENPDFSSYHTSGRVERQSPISMPEMLSMSASDLVDYLNQVDVPKSTFTDEPSIEGLVKTLTDAVKERPDHFFSNLESFIDLDYAYIHPLLRAFHDLWSDKAPLSWDSAWEQILKFCEAVILKEKFWSEEAGNQKGYFVANRLWIVGEIGKIIQVGTKSDNHAFSPKYNEQARRIIVKLLEKQEGNFIEKDQDPILQTINSPRGKCLEAIIYLALRECRLASKSESDHASVWQSFEPIFNSEISGSITSNHDFIALVTNYLFNFRYMSGEWTRKNYPRIFNQEDHLQWLCAMKAYPYIGRFDAEIFSFLKDNHHLTAALDDEYLKNNTTEKIITDIFLAYYFDDESIEDKNSMISFLINRKDEQKIASLIRYAWTQRGAEAEEQDKLKKKVMALWPHIYNIIDTETKVGRKLASMLCLWMVFVDEVTEENLDWLLQAAEFCEEDYNSKELLEGVVQISINQPEKAFKLWMAALEHNPPDYPEAAIRTALENLVAFESDGKQMATNIVDEYIRHGNTKPLEILQEILDSQSTGN